MSSDSSTETAVGAPENSPFLPGRKLRRSEVWAAIKSHRWQAKLCGPTNEVYVADTPEWVEELHKLLDVFPIVHTRSSKVFSEKPGKAKAPPLEKTQLSARHAIKERHVLYERQNAFCHYCGLVTEFSQWSIDHRVPLSRGGSWKLSNKVGACKACNGAKANLTEDEYNTVKHDSVARKQLIRVWSGVAQRAAMVRKDTKR